MSKKMNGELKFQLEMAKGLYIGEIMTCLQVSMGEQPNTPFGYWTCQMIGDGKVFMAINRMVIKKPNTDLGAYDTYQHENLEMGVGYKKVEPCRELNVGTDKKKKICVEFKGDHGVKVWIRDKHLEYFEDYEVWARDEFSPVIIFSKVVPRIEGVIYPFVVRK